MLTEMIKNWEGRAAKQKKSYQDVLAKLSNTAIDDASENSLAALEEYRVAYRAYTNFASSARALMDLHGEELSLAMVAAEVAAWIVSKPDRTTQSVLSEVLRDVSYRATRLTSIRETSK
jgi:hypothetical protein